MNAAHKFPFSGSAGSRAFHVAIGLIGLLVGQLRADPSYLLLGTTWDQHPNDSLCVVNTSTGLATAYTTVGDHYLMGIAYDEIGDRLYAANSYSSIFLKAAICSKLIVSLETSWTAET